MKMKILLVVLLVLLTHAFFHEVLSIIIQNIEGPVGYEESVTKYTFYSFDFDLPIQSEAIVQSSEITVTLDSESPGEIYLSVDNVYCSPDHWSFPASTRYQITFDCKNSLNSPGQHTVRFYTSVDVSNVKIDYKIVYGLPQNLKIHIFGTEYHPGDIATVFLQLLDENDAPVRNSTCFVRDFSIFYFK